MAKFARDCVNQFNETVVENADDPSGLKLRVGMSTGLVMYVTFFWLVYLLIVSLAAKHSLNDFLSPLCSGLALVQVAD